MTTPEATAQVKSQPRPSAPGPVTATTEGITSMLIKLPLLIIHRGDVLIARLSAVSKSPRQAAQPHPNGR